MWKGRPLGGRKTRVFFERIAVMASDGNQCVTTRTEGNLGVSGCDHGRLGGEGPVLKGSQSTLTREFACNLV